MRARNLSPWLAICLAVAVGCSPGPNTNVDGATPDSATTTDSSTVTDTGVTTDSSVPTDVVATTDVTSTDGPMGMRCGTTTCGPDQVCCAASGPTMPERCTSASMCSQIRCDGPEHCSSGNTCCTDGIQSLCRPSGECSSPACRTADDCPMGEMCCPFGAGQRTCRTSC